MPYIRMNARSLFDAQQVAAYLEQTVPQISAHIILDNGEAMADVQRWYQQKLPHHWLMPELTAQGYTLMPFAELDPDDIERLSSLVNCFPYEPDQFDPVWYDEPETAADLAAALGEALFQPEAE